MKALIKAYLFTFIYFVFTCFVGTCSLSASELILPDISKISSITKTKSETSIAKKSEEYYIVVQNQNRTQISNLLRRNNSFGGNVANNSFLNNFGNEFYLSLKKEHTEYDQNNISFKLKNVIYTRAP